MKLKNIFLILFLCCTSLCFAQDKLFEKYADMDNVTSVFISKKMFDMIPNVESGGLNLMNLKGKINNLQLLPTEQTEHPGTDKQGENNHEVRSMRITEQVNEL